MTADDRGLAALAERLRDEIHIDPAHGFPVGYSADDLAAAILGDSGRFSPDGGLDAAAREVLRATDAYMDAKNGQGHPGVPHDRAIHIDPCTSLPGVEHVYSDSTDCAACGGAEYGTEDDLQIAIVGLRLALGLPLKPWEEHHRAALATPKEEQGPNDADDAEMELIAQQRESDGD